MPSILAPSRSEIIKLGRANNRPVRKRHWDRLAEEFMKVHGGTVPAAEEIEETFGSWEDFLIECGFPDYGLFNAAYVRRDLNTLQKIKTTQFPHCPEYFGRIQQQKREIILGLALDTLPDPSDVRYVGLAGPNFLDYLLLHEYGFGVNPAACLVAERWWFAANAMQSIIKNADEVEGGNVFKYLNLYRGWLHDALKEPRYADMRFNFAYFDFTGSWDTSKSQSVDNLFAYNHADDTTTLFITVNDSTPELEKLWYRKDGNNRKYKHRAGNQHIIVAGHVSETSERHGYASREIMKFEYSDPIPMLTVGFLLEKA